MATNATSDDAAVIGDTGANHSAVESAEAAGEEAGKSFTWSRATTADEERSSTASPAAAANGSPSSTTAPSSAAASSAALAVSTAPSLLDLDENDDGSNDGSDVVTPRNAPANDFSAVYTGDGSGGSGSNANDTSYDTSYGDSPCDRGSPESPSASSTNANVNFDLRSLGGHLAGLDDRGGAATASAAVDTLEIVASVSCPSPEDEGGRGDAAAAAADGFVRSGTRLRTLVGSALRSVAAGFSRPDEEEEVDERSLTSGRDRGCDSSGKEEDRSPSTSSAGVGRKRPNRDLADLPQDVRGGARARHDYAAELAREKAAEVVVLQRSLKEAEAHAAAMEASNATLRDSAAASAERVERTAEALRIAGTNAANARADADAAEARAAALASQIRDLRSVVEETRRGTDAVRSEHDEVSAATRSVEARLVEAEAALLRAERERGRAEEERDGLLARAEDADRAARAIRDELDSGRDELVRAKKMAAERDAVERARLERTHRVENELRDARAMLVEATSTAAETESTTAFLNETIRELRKENESLHDKIEETLNNASKERARLNESLARSEGEAQQLRMKAASEEEEVQRLRLDKAAAEKQIAQLKDRISNLERRLMVATTTGAGLGGGGASSATLFQLSDPTSAITPRNQVGRRSDSNSTGGGSNASKGSSFVIPPLRSAHRTAKPGDTSRLGSTVPSSTTSTSSSGGGGKENRSNASASSSSRKSLGPGVTLQSATCSVCFKSAFGIMKSCKCGRPSCDKRAHASCLAKGVGKSVSHPGTPAPQVPVILCSGETT